MRKMIIMLSIFSLLLCKENKLKLTLNVTEANTNYNYLGPDFFIEFKPKGMDSYMINYTDTGIKTLELSWENNITSLKFMFSECSNIISIDFTDFDTSKVTNMCGMFVGCTSLTSIDLSNIDT